MTKNIDTQRVSGRRFLVTGGTGFLGSGLVRELLAGGAIVRSFDNNSRGAPSKLGAAIRHVELVEGDIRDAGAVACAVRGVDCVCHLAYVNGTEFFYTRPAEILEVAVKGMMNVLDACVQEEVPELVLASSSEVYQTPPVIPTDEQVPLSVPDVLNPRYSYGGGKIICELLAINYGRKFFQRTTIFRPHNVYGPDMGNEHVIPQFAVRMGNLHRSQPAGTLSFPIQGTGRETRSFLYIDDMSSAILRIIERGEHLGIYHVGSGKETSIEELATEIGLFYGREILIDGGELRAGGSMRRCPDIAKLSALGFVPKVSLREGLRKTIAWYDELE